MIFRFSKKKNKIPKEGYLYIAVGEKFVREAINSVKSLRAVDKNAHVTLITNKKVPTELFDNQIINALTLLKNNEIIQKEQFKKSFKLFKVKNFNNSPYKKTFYIDTDTYFCDSCRELFQLLDYFDICVAHSPNDRAKIEIDGKILEGYHPYNSGVIVYKKNKNTKKFFDSWKKFYLDSEFLSDQKAFAKAYLNAKVKIYVLQSIYNARIPFYTSFIGKPVKLIHGRNVNFKHIEKILNKEPDKNRTWDPINKKIFIKLHY